MIGDEMRWMIGNCFFLSGSQFSQVVSLAKKKKIASFFILSALLNIKGKRNESEWYEIIGELGELSDNW